MKNVVLNYGDDRVGENGAVKPGRRDFLGLGMGAAAASPARYIGVMGPRERTGRMLRELAAGADPSRPGEAGLARLHAPAGLDLGADSPAEVALSIVAEMRAVLDGRRGGSLRERRGSIHADPGDGERVRLTKGQALDVAVA